MIIVGNFKMQIPTRNKKATHSSTINILTDFLKFLMEFTVHSRI